ncbi:hypothetical protein CXF54_10445 [Olleya sp. 1-3]|nr:hypothetical protein CXF54_10445 [Olleya sp. 1-3]
MSKLYREAQQNKFSIQNSKKSNVTRTDDIEIIQRHTELVSVSHKVKHKRVVCAKLNRANKT